MKIDITEINQDDYLIAFHNIGNLPPYDVDKYCDKLLEPLSEVFGCPVSIFPVRDGETWEMVLIRNPNRKEHLKKQDEKRKREELAKVKKVA